MYDEFKTLDEISTKISDDEYSLFLARQEKKGYINDLSRNDATGEIIDANECLLEGMKILAEIEL